jgi:hypothetical protein
MLVAAEMLSAGQQLEEHVLKACPPHPADRGIDQQDPGHVSPK